MINKLLKYLENTGKCKVLVDTFGNILFKRYFLFGVEPDEQDIESGKAKARWLPNVWLHKIVESENGADGSTYHRHPWITISYIVSGGYKEHTEGEEPIWRNKGTFIFRDDKSRHYIGKTKHNTMTLFFHGFRNNPSWNFKPTSCVSGICEDCKIYNNSICKKGELEFSFKEYLQNLNKKEIPNWVVYNNKGKKRIALRQKASKKLGVHKFNLAQVDKLLQDRFISRIRNNQIKQI